MARRKYRKGETILSLGALVAEIEADHAVFMHDKVQNAAWLMSMQLHTLAQFAKSGGVAYAIQENETNAK